MHTRLLLSTDLLRSCRIIARLVQHACLLSLQGIVADIISAGDFEAKQGTSSKAVRLAAAAGGPKYVALLGLGKADTLKKAAADRYGANPFQVNRISYHCDPPSWLAVQQSCSRFNRMIVCKMCTADPLQSWDRARHVTCRR